MEFNMSDMFEVETKAGYKARAEGKSPIMQPGTEFDKVDETYMLMGLVCFVGAHYFSFVKAFKGNKI